MISETKISIYLVEDYLLIRKSLLHVLSKEESFELLGDFETAEDFFCCFDRKPSDIVIMDLGLPGMNGIEATRLIKEKSPSTKVVILSSHEAEDEVLAALSSGASAYCLKDILSNELCSILKDVYKGVLWLHPGISGIASKAIPKPNSTDFGNLYTKTKSDIHLTEREKEALSLVVEGKSNTEIAKMMNISSHTAKAHVGSILTKLAVTDRVQAAVKAVRTRLID